MRPLYEQVGLRIKQLREERGLSQEALAARCNLHRTYVGLIERGKRILSIPTLETIAKAFGVAPARLLEGLESLGAVPASKDPARQSTEGRQVAAHLATIRQILINAKLTDERRYELFFKANLKR